MTAQEKAGLPVLAFPDGAAFEAWLAAQPADSPGLWVKFAKKASGIASITDREAIDAALCHGWIDGQRDRFDDRWYLNKYTPRRARSRWSRINCARALELVTAGRMRPAGLAEIERAKADGRWDAAYAPPSKAEVPADLAAALDADPAATAFFATLSAQNRFAILYRVQDAKKPETRAARIAKFVAMLGRGETIYPQKPRPAPEG